MARTRNPRAKRDAILNAARAAFESDGFEKSSTAQIADNAGVSEGIVFHHFGSKHGLLEACAHADAVDFIEREMPYHSAGLDYDRLAEAIFDWVTSDRMARRLWSEGDHRVVGVLRRGWQRAIVAAVSAALLIEQRKGRCREGDTQLFASMQFAVVGEALIAHFAQPRSLPRPEAAAITAQAVAALVAP